MWTPPNRLLPARIAGQFGLVTRSQALGAGVTRSAISWQLETEQWVRVHPGVYLTVPGRDSWKVRAMAALLWAGPGAALFRSSAGHAWGLSRYEPDPLEVAVPAERRVRDTGGVTVVRSRQLRERVDPMAWPHRITAAHTVFDLAAGRPVDAGITLAARSLDLGIATVDDLVTALRTRTRQPDRAVLLEALFDVSGGSESAAEVRYVRDVERAHGLPTGRRQVPVGDGRRCDVEYEEFGVVVEIDGRLNHESWSARRRDAVKDRAAAVTGRVSVHCFWTDLVPTACRLTLDVVAILRMRGWTGEPFGCSAGCPVGCGTSVMFHRA